MAKEKLEVQSSDSDLSKAWDVLKTYEAAGDSYKETFAQMKYRKCLLFVKWAYFLCWASGGLIVKAVIKYFFTPPKEIFNEVALVTGGGNGLGRAITYELIKRGAHVAVCDIDIESAKQTVETARSMMKGGICYAYQVDVTDISALKDLKLKINSDFGKPVSILINNAGVMVALDLMLCTKDDIKKVMEVNCLSHFWTIKTFLPDMCDKNHGHIVTIASMGAFVGLQYAVPYCTSKWAVRGMMEALRAELKDQKYSGIHLTCVNPFFTATRKYIVDYIQTNLSKMSPEETAFYTIDAMARNYEIITIPAYLYSLFMFSSIFSRSCMTYVQRHIFQVRVEIEKIRELFNKTNQL